MKTLSTIGIAIFSILFVSCSPSTSTSTNSSISDLCNSGQYTCTSYIIGQNSSSQLVSTLLDANLLPTSATQAISISGVPCTSIIQSNSGQFLHCLSSSLVTSWEFSSVGTFSQVQSTTVVTANFPSEGSVSPSGSFFAGTNTSSNIGTYAFNASTGILASTVTSSLLSTGVGKSRTWSPDSKSLYVVNSAADIEVYSVSTTGILTSLQTLGLTNALRAVMHPSGTYVYVSTGSGTVLVYLRNTSTGVLSLATTISGLINGSEMAISPNGRILVLANTTIETVLLSSSGATGALVGTIVEASTRSPVISYDNQKLYLNVGSVIKTYSLGTTSATIGALSQTFPAVANVSGDLFFVTYLQ